MISQVVLTITSSIFPIKFEEILCPYLTVFDPIFKSLSVQTEKYRSILFGATNPLFIKVL